MFAIDDITLQNLRETLGYLKLKERKAFPIEGVTKTFQDRIYALEQAISYIEQVNINPAEILILKEKAWKYDDLCT